MQTSIRAVAALLACGAITAAAQVSPDEAPCAPSGAAVLERFISAECSACWSAAPSLPAGKDQWLLDWIVPSVRGDEAPLSAAAPGDAAQRARRALVTGTNDERTVEHRSAARSTVTVRLTVASGPAFNGYIGVQLDGRGRAPAQATVWIALVESVAAGTDGTPVPRQLVRSVAGPFQPRELQSGKPWRVLQAMRWPETAKPERLLARAWLERSDGAIVAMAGEHCKSR